MIVNIVPLKLNVIFTGSPLYVILSDKAVVVALLPKSLLEN